MLRWDCRICGCQSIAKSLDRCPQCGAPRNPEPEPHAAQLEPRDWRRTRPCRYPGCTNPMHYNPDEEAA